MQSTGFYPGAGFNQVISGDGCSPEVARALDDAPCGLARTSQDGVFLRVNSAFCAWVGYSAEELVGKRKVQDLLTMGGKIFHQTHWAPLLQMQGSISEVRLEIIRKDGGTIPMILNAVRSEKHGVIVHDLAAFVSRDRDKFEQELVAARRKLEVIVAEATQMREETKDRALFAEQLVGIASHDLRNPLSTISMGAAVLARGELSASQIGVLGRVTRAVERANRLITDLLDFTQARLGQGLKVSRKPIDLHRAVAEAVEELSLAFPTRELRHIKEGPGACNADADRLSQMVGNLVSNAMSYGNPAHPVTVTSKPANGKFSVSVHNFGKPIPVEARATLFQAMVRGEAATSSARSVGLGLYIVSEIAKAHGGGVEVSSDETSGTEFTVTIPG
ncbi:MAG TPA: HAMP domain-containing sensor histidine kinase [Polaromonas sp.]|uniref:PAS domain-containing sensor histidine kinase n=1 Tax=Polaromonas sp. TaxID=1869339 RepID=UPI002D6240F6|nr:HAMP domain-containing sensor histidine kinase [Polaromonas sp.]HYW56122.1 HAMP domain-containing sensor histidine kinase [Polaromonas sp.]